MRVTILGTGSVASRLGTLLAHGGQTVVWASRSPTAPRTSLPPAATVVSLTDSAVNAEVVVVAVPWKAADGSSAIDALHAAQPGPQTIICDATNPLNADWSPLSMGDSSAGETVAASFPRHSVLKMFNTIFADMMLRSANLSDAPTAFFASTDQRARQVALELAASCGFPAIDCGDLRAARHLEAMAHLNIRIALAGGGTRAALVYRRQG